MSQALSDLPLSEVKGLCQQERAEYRQGGDPISAACVELFRRAFVTLEVVINQATLEDERVRIERERQWAAADVIEIFGQLTLSWVYNAKGTNYTNLAHYFTPEAAILIRDLAFTNFFRYASRYPDLVDTNELGRLMTFLRKCAESATREILLSLRREAQRAQYIIRIDKLMEEDETDGEVVERLLDKVTARQPTVEQLAARAKMQRALDACLQSELHDEKERLLFFLRFECGEPPRTIFANYQTEFPTYQAVETTLQRITRRLRKSDCLQRLQQEMSSMGSARRKPGDDSLLKIELDHHLTGMKKDINVDTPCPYSEEILLDYLCNLVSAELAAAIEASPTCRQMAGQLAKSQGPWLKAVYRRHCPEVGTLLAYHDRELSATERLVCYRHLAQCPRCQEELALLATPEASPAVSLFTGLRKVVEAIFQSPLELQFQGEWLQYNTPQVTINIDERQSPGKSRSWTVRAQLRDQEGQLLTNRVELATLEAATPEAAAPAAVPPLLIHGTFSATSIVFRDLPPGDYSLQLVLPEEEIIIRKVTVGFTS